VCGAHDGRDISDRVGAASRSEATSAVQSWGSTPRQYGRAAVEMKAGKRCGGEEGMQEARRNAVVERTRGLAW
jgi:hypothetical protein